MNDYNSLPAHMQRSARRYIYRGIPPGSFLEAVICNNLTGAFQKADDINREAMFDWVRFFYNEAPADCWGSAEKFNGWIARGGLLGGDA